jgi:hypothetical protein
MAQCTDTQSYYYQQYQSNLQDWSINRWLKKHGINVHDLESHPRIEDVIDLLKIRQSFWPQMTNSEQGVWAAYWSMVYHKRRTLKSKAWIKFERIAQAIDQRQQRISQIRQHRSPQAHSNKGRNMTANCPDQPDSKLVKRESLGGRKEQSLLPWE